MYEKTSTLRLAPRLVDLPPGLDPEAGFRVALARVRKALGAFVNGTMTWGPTRHILEGRRTEGALEVERLIAVGWLAWLNGALPAAEIHLTAADDRCRQTPPVAVDLPGAPPLEANALSARAAYWRARVRQLLGREGAVSDYESALRRLGGSPQATAWYVDLLWRAGRVDRAEQVWKSVRSNKRVLALDEGTLIEARATLRRGELGQAERLLREATLTSGVAAVERQLLLAWALADLRRPEPAREAMDQASQGPYPERTLADWKRFLEARLSGELPGVDVTAQGWREFVAGQRARLRGTKDEAAASYRAAALVPAVAPFARYGLVCLGEEDAQAVLAAVPGFFLAARARVRQAVDRFRRREMTPGEFLEALSQPGAASFQDETIEHYQRLANVMQARQVTPVYLRDLAKDQAAGPARRNALRVALEMAARRLGPAELRFLLGELRPAVEAAGATDLSRRLGALLFRSALVQGSQEGLEAVGDFLPGEPLVAFARGLLEGGERTGTANEPAGLLYTLARDLAAGRSWPFDAMDRLAALRSSASYSGLAQSLLFSEAAQRGNVDAALAALDESEPWRAFTQGPPNFVVRALEAMQSAHPAHPGWAKVLPRWLLVWSSGTAVPTLSNLSAAQPVTAPPPGVAPAAWCLYQGVAAAAREDFANAADLVERAIQTEAPGDPLVGEALNAFRLRADAAALARTLHGVEAPVFLVDLVACLSGQDEGKAILTAARQGDGSAVEAILGRLSERTDLPGRLGHHLAILSWRQAQALETHDPSAAVRLWRRSWAFWVGFLASPHGPSGRPRELLIDHLLGQHRFAVVEYLGSDDMESARSHWELLQEVPMMARERSGELGNEVSNRGLRCREELIAEYSGATRQAMKQGEIPAGWKGDHDLGTLRMARLMRLTPDSVRVLTSLLEMAVDWFSDLDTSHDHDRLRNEVDRFTPEAAQLARLLEDRGGGLPARLTLSSFYRYRAQVAIDMPTRITLLREALRYNPGNDAARLMLVQLGIRDEEGAAEDHE